MRLLLILLLICVAPSQLHGQATPDEARQALEDMRRANELERAARLEKQLAAAQDQIAALRACAICLDAK